MTFLESHGVMNRYLLRRLESTRTRPLLSSADNRSAAELPPLVPAQQAIIFPQDYLKNQTSKVADRFF